MSRISTGTGDAGTTGLVDGSRVGKADARIDAFGDVDEANAVLGLAAALADDATRDLLRSFQRDLFTLGADLASPGGTTGALRIGEDDVRRVESVTDRLEAALPPLRRFVLPGGTPLAAHLHLARTVVRRAERRAWAVAESAKLNPHALVYLNRLSDCLFLLAREANAKAGVTDPEWVGRGR